jgi:tellurite resistance protein TerC
MNPWIIFTAAVIFLIVVDLEVLHLQKRAMSLRKSLYLSIFYIIIACLFGVYIYFEMSPMKASEYFTGYLLEKVMSLDNIFVISMIFNLLKIPDHLQHRVLLIGIISVIIFRALMIFAGVTLLQHFTWLLSLFSVLLIFTGIKTIILVYKESEQFNLKESRIYLFLKEKFRISNKLHGEDFTFVEDGKRYFTPLFLALIMIEIMDLVFAVDSIPAIFAITQDSFIVYTSNIFAILGLRALFFCLSHMIKMFKYIKYSIGLILIFIGCKLFISQTIMHVPSTITLMVTITLLFGGVITSIIKR